MYLHKTSAPESHRHPRTSPEEPAACYTLVLHRLCLLSETSLLPYLLSSSSSQSKFSVMSMSGQAMLCWAGQINVSFSAAQEEMQPFLLPTTAPSTWLINNHVLSDGVWNNKCLWCCPWLFVNGRRECDFLSNWVVIGDRGRNPDEMVWKQSSVVTYVCGFSVSLYQQLKVHYVTFFCHNFGYVVLYS